MTYDPVADLVHFNTLYNSDGAGGRWTVEGREFIVEEIFRPLYSYNRVPSGQQPVDALCDECRLHVGTWVFDPFLAPMHGRIESCVGLVGVPIINTGADLPRQSGKTTTALAIPYGQMFLESFVRVSFTASAEDQAVELVIQKLAQKIDQHPALKKAAHITANKVEVPRNNSQLEILPSSHGSSTGRSTTLNEYDECRDQRARVVTASMPAILAQHGYKCPAGHGRWKALDNGEPEHESCPAKLGKSKSNPRKCGERLVRWHARQLFLSASGVIEDDPSKDWFRHWIDNRQERPDPFTHVFRTDQKINPSVSSDIRQGIQGSFGDVAGMRDYLDAELNNQPTRMGEDYVTAEELEAVTDVNLRPVDGSMRPTIGFIDTSRTSDKTSEVRVIDSSKPGDLPFEFMDLASIAVWNPRDPASCPEGIVDDSIVSRHLESSMPMWPGLVRYGVDTRIMAWAKRLVKAQKVRPWGRRIVDTEGWLASHNSAMYLELHQRIRGRRIRLFGCLSRRGDGRQCEKCVGCELQRELRSMRKRDLPGGGIEVTDAGADKSGRARRKGGIHRDIAMSLAACCYLAAEVRLESMRSGSGALAQRANESRDLSHIRPIVKVGRQR